MTNPWKSLKGLCLLVLNLLCCRGWCWWQRWTGDSCRMRRTMSQCLDSVETALAVGPKDSGTLLSFPVILIWSLPRSPRNRSIWSTTSSLSPLVECVKDHLFLGKVGRVCILWGYWLIRAVLYINRNIEKRLHISLCWFSSGSSIVVELEFRVFVFWREENWRTWRKTLGARREPTTNSAHIHLWHRARI